MFDHAPRVVIIGRPNVGKSTLFNRLVGRKLALVDDRPGVTRDRREGEASLHGLDFTVIDTAGLEEAAPDSLAGRMRAQTEAAVDTADLTLFMIDARAGVTPLDAHFASLLHALGKPVVLVLLNGRPLSINWAAEHIPAILEAWEPGTEGGHAVADVLFGEVNPGGKLPVSFPRKGSHAPVYYARNLTHSPEGSPMYNPRYWDGLPVPLFPFGFGLSYTTFAFSNLKVSAQQVRVNDTVTVSVDVANTGEVAGDEVAQLYIHQKWGSDSRPMRELKGFKRITLQPGETKTVTFQLGPDELKYWSTNAAQWIQEAAEFDIWVGADSLATLHTELKVVA